MKVIVQGAGEVSLTQRDFVSQGGEGAVYAKDRTAYKVYTDPKKMIPVGKIAELSAITDPGVIRPERVLTDTSGAPIGYTMRYAGSDCVVLCQSFTKAFRQRVGLGHDQVLRLVQRLREEVASVHAASALVVDLNEMNFLLDRTLTDVFAIDVDSYQTKSYPATALMESVRDRHAKKNHFDAGTDWFAFAITSFQMFVGIHPYKGKHPGLKTLDERMLANVTVLDKSVAVPSACYSFDVIPKGYRAWYEQVLTKGERSAPPVDVLAMPVVAQVLAVLASSGQLEVTEAGRFEGDVIGVWEHGGRLVVATEKWIYVDGKKTVKNTLGEIRGVCFSNKMSKPILATRSGLVDAVTGLPVAFGCQMDEATSYGGRLYVRSGDKILEVIPNDVGTGVICAPRVVTSCMERATRLWDGCAIQNMLGATWVSIFPRAGEAPQVRVPELDGKTIVDAKYDGGVLMVVAASRAGRYDRLVLRFSEDGQKYDLRVIPDVDPSGLNFITLDSGVCVCLGEDGRLEAFSTKMGKQGARVVEDKALSGGVGLCRKGGRAAFFRGDRIYQMTLK